MRVLLFHFFLLIIYLAPNKIVKVIKEYKANLLNVVVVTLTGFGGGTTVLGGETSSFGSSLLPPLISFLIVPHPNERTIVAQNRQTRYFLISFLGEKISHHRG